MGDTGQWVCTHCLFGLVGAKVRLLSPSMVGYSVVVLVGVFGVDTSCCCSVKAVGDSNNGCSHKISSDAYSIPDCMCWKKDRHAVLPDVVDTQLEFPHF